MRVQPKPSIAWIIGIGYALLFLALEAIMGVGYDEIGATTDNIIRGIVIPLAVGSLVLIIVTTVLGWWRPVLRDLPDGPPRPPRWLLVVPVLAFIAALLGIDYGNLGNMGGAMILWLALGTAMVGFSEETAYRGLAVVGFRGGYSEVKVWLFSSILFGLLHGVNVILGQGAGPTVRQVIFAFVIGSVFYAIRRITGTLIIPMVIHALWDFGSFSHVAGKATDVVAGDIDLAAAGMGHGPEPADARRDRPGHRRGEEDPGVQAEGGYGDRLTADDDHRRGSTDGHQDLATRPRRARGQAPDALVARVAARRGGLHHRPAGALPGPRPVQGRLLRGAVVRARHQRDLAPAALPLAVLLGAAPVQLRRPPRPAQAAAVLHRAARRASPRWPARRSLLVALGKYDVGGSEHVTTGVSALLPVLAVMVVWLVQGSTEEILMRGYLLQTSGNQMPGWLAIVLVSFGFAAIHMNFQPLVLANITLVAVFFSFVSLAQGSLWAACGFHVGWNAMQGSILGIPVSGNAYAVSVFAFGPAKDAPAWLTGGEFGVEGSAVATVVLVVLVVLVLPLLPQGRSAADRRGGDGRGGSGGHRGGAGVRATLEVAAARPG